MSFFYRFEFERVERYSMEPASIRDRVIAQVIDGIFLGFLCGFTVYLFSGGLLHSIWVSPMVPQYLLEPGPGHLPAASDFWWGGAYYSLDIFFGKTIHLAYPAPLLWLYYGLYYTIFAFKNGQTPGKMIKKLVILDLDQNKISFSKSFLRWLGYFFSLLPFGLGIWWALGNEKHRTWHDLFGNTVVYSFEKKQR